MKLGKSINLYISIGNTTSTFAVFESDNIEENNVVKKTTKELVNTEEIDSILFDVFTKLNIQKIKKVYVCSVVSILNKKIQNFFTKNETDVIFLSTENQYSLNLSKLYNKWELGADLIAQSIYVAHFFEEAIIVSLGTVTAIYHIKNNTFNGCIIMPGIKTSQVYLEELIDIKFPILNIQEKNLGLNTKEAISIGILNSVKTIIDNLMAKLKIKCPVIYTGGNSDYFTNLQWWHINNLEILGLFIFSKNHRSVLSKKNVVKQN